MKQLTALICKEWHKAQAFLWIALGVFVGLPVIKSVEAMFQLSKRFEVSMLPLVLGFGAVLAVFVAVGMTCRDFQGRLEDFWRSRPVGVIQWIAVKYCVGLFIVMAACLIPLTLDFALDRKAQWAEGTPLRHWYLFMAELSWFLLLLSGFFSLGFLAGCLVRRAAHAAVLALAAMLLICLLPALLPPLALLGQFSPFRIVISVLPIYVTLTIVIGLASLTLILVALRKGWRAESGRKLMIWAAAGIALILILAVFGSSWQRSRGYYRDYYTGVPIYGIVMGAIALISLAVAIVAVQRGWRVESGRKLLYWAIGIVFLVIIGSAGYQVGTNLPVLQQAALLPNERASYVWTDGKTGFVVSSISGPLYLGNIRREFELRADGISIQDEKPNDEYWLGRFDCISPEGHPDIYYSVTERIRTNTEDPSMCYAECWLDENERNGNTATQLDIWHEAVKVDGIRETLDELNYESPVLYRWKDRLYAIGRTAGDDGYFESVWPENSVEPAV